MRMVKNVLTLRLSILLLAVSLILCCAPFAASAFKSPGFYSGRLVDAETGQPIEGAVVVGFWFSHMPMEKGSRFYALKEIRTNHDGEFRIVPPPAALTGVLPNKEILDEMDFLIFKAGYEHLDSAPWESLKADMILRQKIRWEGSKAFIPLRKLTVDERRKRDDPDYSASVPDGQLRFLCEELEKERKDTWSKEPRY